MVLPRFCPALLPVTIRFAISSMILFLSPFYFHSSLNAQYTVSTVGTWNPQYNNPIYVPLSANQLSTALPIGFNFPFFGNTYSQFYISSNGFITFSAGSGSGPVAQTIPNASNPNNLIAMCWGAVNPDYIDIDYETIGTFPNRSLHVNFAFENFGNGGSCANGYELYGQIILKESGYVIEIHSEYWSGDQCAVSTTQGIENANGTIAFVTPGRNNQLWNAYETFTSFTPLQATDVAVTTYEPSLCVGTQNIDIIVQNLSPYILDSLYLDWTWDGIAQDDLFITGPFTPQDTMLVTLGQKTIAANTNYNLKAWSYNPDNDIDINHTNDTIIGVVHNGLNGIKTIGGTTPDYVTIADAITALETNGVCDSVIFDIRPGTYTESLDIDLFSSSGVGKAVFRSSTGIATDVIITKNYTVSGSNRLIDINQADKVIFRKLTLKVTGSACSNVLYTEGDCEGIEVSNCIIRGSTCTTVSSGGAAISFITGDKKTNRIVNNDISLGVYGIYFSPGSGKFANNLLIENNYIDSSYRAGIIINRPQNLSIHNNDIFCPQSSAYGIDMLTGFGECRITSNSINVPISPYGCRVTTFEDNNGTDTCLIANNMITLGGSISNSKALMVESSEGARIYHNSLHSTSTLSTGVAISVITSTVSHIKNNIISNAGIGKAANLGTVVSDYNVFYNTTQPLLSNGSTNYNTLTNWQTATNQDLHSLNLNPAFISNANLHTNNLLLNGKGTPLTPPVATDFDGETRNASLPDPGADETGFISNDIAVASVYFPNQLAAGANEARAIVTNVGTNTVSSYNVNWSINAGTPVNLPIAIPLVAGGSDTITLGNVNMVIGSNYLVKTYTSSPNGNADGNLLNDTLTIGPVYPALNGLYTVYGPAPNFATITAALTAIQLGGIIDSVQLAIRDGFFHDPVIPGASTFYNCAKPIRFFSESGNVNNVIIDNGNQVNAVVKLSNVKGFHFQNITFQLTASAFHNVVLIENAASCNSFTGCKFIGRISTQTSTVYATVLCNSTQDINNDFYNNIFQYGSYGLSTNGPNLTSGSGVDIDGNTFLDNYYQGLSAVNSPQIRIVHNSVALTSAKYTDFTGMFANGCKRMDMSHNKVINPFSGGTALGFSECDGTAQDTTRVFNNYVYATSSNNLVSVFGSGYSDYTHVANNTSRAINGRAAGFSWSANFRIENNIFRTLGNNPVLELLNMQGTNIICNHNCLSSPNGNIGELNNTQYPTMAQWQALGYDVNSFVTDPLFDGTTNYAHNALLNGVAIPYYFIDDDLDGEARNATNPDLGSNEFTPAINDGGVLAMLSPVMPFPTGSNPVFVKFYNNGDTTLSSLQFNWSINNVTQTPYTWNGILSSAEEYDSLEIGQYTFSPYTEYDIRIWITLPNGMPDSYTPNDTLKIDNQIAGMAGIYTIGGDEPDFETITAAVAALQAGGVSDDVTFNIRNGIYAEPILIQDFPGSDCDHIVTFQSESGSATDVTITNLGINAHTVVLNGADGVKFNKLTIVSVNTSFRHAVQYSNGSNCNSFTDNILIGFQSTSTANTSAVVRSLAGIDTANVFTGNTIKYGSFGFHLTGTLNEWSGVVINNNHFQEVFYRGIYASRQNGIQVKGNDILITGSTTGRGMEIIESHELDEIAYNKIIVTIGQYGIVIENCDETASAHGKIYNNFVSVGGTGVARGIYVNASSFVDVIHNSINTYSTNATLDNTAPIYVTNNTSLQIINNAARNAGTGYAISANANTPFTADRNAYYTAGTTFGFWNAGAAETTFALWKTASAQDANSINANPVFLSNTDLHTFLVLLNGVAQQNTGIPDDFDGEVRSSTPDIGADEFLPLVPDDAGIFAYIGPVVPFASGVSNVQVNLKNFGANALTSVTIRWTVNGFEQTPYNWTGNLASSAGATVTVGTFNFLPITSYIINVWTEMPNGTADTNPTNDLLATNTFYPSLSGTYTVGGFTPNFNLVSDLETILNASGIVNNVTFNFRPGTYTEAILVHDFPRINYAHSVTFQSEAGDSTSVVLTQSVNNMSLIDLDDAHRITFKKMTLLNTKGHVLYIRNGSSLITIENNRLEGLETLSSSRSLVYSPTTNEDSITIQNNVLKHGYYGVHLYGTGFEKRHIIQGNTFIGNFNYGVYLRAFDGLTLSRNTFNATATGQRDVYMYNGTGACIIEQNKIIADNTQVAVLMSTMTNTSPNPTRFTNNYIYKSGPSNYDVVYMENISKINIDFNSIYNAVNHVESASLYTSNLTTCNIRDNILYAIQGPCYDNVGVLPVIHNYNAIFSLGPVEAKHNNISYSTLSAFATATSTNANSKAVDPLFVSTSAPTISQYLLNATGLAIAGITTDIDGSTRTSPPDIGAKEFSPIAHDIQMSKVAAPTDDCGLTSSESLQVVLVNRGSMNATGFNVHYIFNGQTTTENIGSQVVPAGDSLYFTFSQSINVEAYQAYSIETYHSYASDLNHANDTASHSFTNYPPFMDPVENLIPSDGTTNLENQVSLSWAPVSGAVSYDMYLWPATGMKPVTPTYAGLSTINKLVTNLLYGTLYRWQIHAVNICDEEMPSDTSSFTTRYLPELVVQSITIPPTGYSEQTIGVEWVTKNQGPGLTVPGTWFDNIYLSPDPTYNSFDPLLKSVSNLSSLNPNQSYSHSAQVTLPQGTNGLYYIIIKTDHYANVKETVENNNTTASASQINVALSPPPDLLVTNMTTPAITFSGETINMTYTVKNLGDGITTNSIWKDEIRLQPAPNNPNGLTTILATKTHIGHLLPDSSYVVNLSVGIPANIFGDYQVRVYTDSKLDVYEFASEGNNTLLSTIIQVVLTPPVDLVPDSLVVPDTISLYKTNAIHYEVRNAGGSSPAIGWTDRYYLSPSPVFNSNFLTHLGYVYHDAGLMPGDTNEKTINLKIIGDYAGIHYLYVVTDYNSKINEYEFEGNNTLRSDPFVIIKPDLKVDSLIHPASAMAGSAFTIRSEVINQGPGDFFGNLNNRYYLSNDAVLSTMTDLQLASKTVNNNVLTTTDTLTQTFLTSVPADQFGSKYLLCQTDASQVVYEANENNNVLASPIMLFESPHPDVQASAFVTPDTITAGVPFHIQYQLSNVGDIAITQQVTDSIFISFSPTWNRAVAIPLGIQTLTLLDTGAMISNDLALSTALQQNPNQYYLYIVSDARAKIYEGSGESNNILRSGQLVLLAYPELDLRLSGLGGVADTVNSGQVLNVTYTIENISETITYYSAWSEKWYFSVDSVFSAATDMAIEVFSYSAGKISGNGSKVTSAALHVPHGITGNYYVFVETDFSDLNNDSNRSNNSNTIRISGMAHRIHIRLAPYPDLSVDNFVCPVEVISGQYFDIITSVANVGERIAGYRTDKLFISTNNIIESGDLALATVVKSPLNNGSVQHDTLRVFVPASYSGNYFIIWAIDHGNIVYEYEREENNILIASIIATPPPPADLIVKNILVPDSVLAGETADISWQTENKGANPAYGQFREIVYLSPDTTWNLTDEVIGIWDGPVLISAGSTVTKTVPMKYNNVTNADYHTIIRTDAKNNIPESNEENNDGYSYDLTNIDIEEIFLESPKEATLADTVNLYYKVYIDAANAGRNLLIELTGDSLTGINQLYTKYGSVPTEADNDYAYSESFSAYQRIVVRDAVPGYYYIMVNGFRVSTSAPQSITILARILKMELLDISPGEAGNKGFVTIEVFGSELDSLDLVKFIKAGSGEYHEILADTFVSLDGGTRVLARFNLAGEATGLYHVQCIRDSRWAPTLRNCFTIFEGSGARIGVQWQLTPKSYNPRFSTIIQIKIDIENIGDADAMDRFVLVGTPNFNNPVYYSLEDYYNATSHTQLVLPSEDLNGFPNILRPGGRRTYYVYGRVGGTQGFSVTYDR